MANDPSFLRRWSRRKHEAVRAAPPAAPPIPAADESVAPAAPAAPAVPAVAAAPAPAPVEIASLPPVESLTLASDFKPFLAAKVEEDVKRAALRKLFSDPHFNVMDGLDIYIGDYSQPDPMPEGWLDKLADVYKTIEERIEVEPPAEAAAIATEAPDASVASLTAEPSIASAEAPSPQDCEPDPDERRG